MVYLLLGWLRSDNEVVPTGCESPDPRTDSFPLCVIKAAFLMGSRHQPFKNVAEVCSGCIQLLGIWCRVFVVQIHIF